MEAFKQRTESRGQSDQRAQTAADDRIKEKSLVVGNKFAEDSVCGQLSGSSNAAEDVLSMLSSTTPRAV